jgi:hypothetical protein
MDTGDVYSSRSAIDDWISAIGAIMRAMSFSELFTLKTPQLTL